MSSVFKLIFPEWLRYFPQDRFFFIKSDDFFQNPAEIFLETLRFLNMPPLSLPVYETRNQTMGEQVKPETRGKMADYFAPWNQKLNEILGRDFGW